MPFRLRELIVSNVPTRQERINVAERLFTFQYTSVGAGIYEVYISAESLQYTLT